MSFSSNTSWELSEYSGQFHMKAHKEMKKIYMQTMFWMQKNHFLKKLEKSIDYW